MRKALRVCSVGVVVLAGCGGGGGGSGGSSGDTGSSSSSATACSVTQKESELSAALTVAPSDVDFSFSVERADGRRFSFSRGASTMTTAYESASTSKLVTAVMILRLVEQGYLNLSDRPQDRIPGWPITNSDPLYNMTLAQLLSFTSGLTVEPLCLNAPGADFASCVSSIATTNAGNGITPGTQFYYASTHLQVAGLMAMKARGFSSWTQVFDEFRTQTGLFPSGAYDLPSSSNPRLAGGMHWTGNEYMNFLKSLKNGALLNASSMTEFLKDRTGAGVSIVYSPAAALGEEWHYGFGFWHECQSATFNCTPATRISSPGAYGAYPFWDRGKSYFGMLARQGALGTFTNGMTTARAVQPQVDAWAACM